MGFSVFFVKVVCCLTLLSVNAARSEDGSGNRFTLPSHLKPILYRVRLMPFIWPGNFTTAGQLDVLVECFHSSHNVTLYAQEIDVLEDSVHIFVQDGEDNLGREIPLDPQRKLQINSKELIIKTSEELEAGSKYRIQMRFVAKLNDRLQGFYRSSYVDKATGEKRWIAVSQFAPRYGRQTFPCFDGIEFKSKFKFSLARKENMRSLSNMPIEKSEPIEDMPGWVWDHYQTTPRMGINLAGYMVSDFVPLWKSDEAGKMTRRSSAPINVWSRAGVLNQTKYAGSILPPIVNYYEDFFNFPYPLPKLDFVAVPEFIFTTMENWGMVVFRESMILFDPRETTTRTKQRITMDIAHEVAHQWFGNLVGPFWWDDVWLNECFANYMEYVGGEYVEPTWRLSEQFPFNEIQNVFFLDALESSHPVHKEVVNPEKKEEIYDSITYIKGTSLIRMLNHSLGESTFRSGLTLYYKAYNNSEADKDDLWQSLTTQAHLDGTLPTDMTVKEVIDTWILQTGYPVVTVHRNYESGLTSFTQERFLLYKDENTTDTSTRWWVPISYTTQENPDFINTRPSFWLNPNDEKTSSISISSGEKWILVNIQEAGYYRVNYDALNWKLLTDQLRSQAGSNEQVIPPSARSQLLDDAFNLARSGLLPYSTALDLCLTLRHDTDYLPWASTFRALEFLDEMLTNTQIYGAFKELMVRLSRELVESLGWEDSNKEGEHIRSLSRDKALRWSCLWGDEKCVGEAKKRFSHWMQSYETNNDPNNRISPDLREIVYCNGIRYGSTKEWEFALQRYLDSNAGAEKSALRNALGCTRESPLLERFLGMMLNSSSGISNQDGRIIFTTMINNPLGNALLFNSLKNNYDQVWKTKGSNLPKFSEIIVTSTKYMTTPEQLAQLKQFWEDHQDNLGSMRKSFKQALAKVEANVKWMERSYEEVKVWIESHK